MITECEVFVIWSWKIGPALGRAHAGDHRQVVDGDRQPAKPFAAVPHDVPSFLLKGTCRRAFGTPVSFAGVKPARLFRGDRRIDALVLDAVRAHCTDLKRTGKTIAGVAKVKVRGLPRVRFKFTFAMAAYNLIRMPRLLAQA